MPIDPSIPLSVKQPQVEDPTNALMRVLQIQGLQDARTKEQRALDQQTALNNAYSGAIQPDGSIDQTALMRVLASGGQGAQIPGVQKSFLENDNTKAQTAQRLADAEKARVDAVHTRSDLVGQASGWLRQNPTAENAIAVTQHLQSNGVITPEQAQASIAKIQANPTPEAIAQSADIAFRTALQAKEQLPKIQTNNTGGSTVTQAVDPVTGQTRTVNTLQNTQSPDNAATIAGENRRSADTLKKDYVVAGFNPDGSAGGDIETTAKAIASGQLPPPSGMALTNPKNQRILSRVMEINPEYDYTSVTAKKTAAAAFTSGPQGNQLRSFQVAGQHLDQLGQLIDALGNNDLPLVNKLGNFISQQTGSPIVTNFDAAKDVVSKEVMKAIVAGGGGEGERAALKNSLDAAKSPAQLKGVVQQYRNLMDAQSSALLDQRDAAGLPRTTLPKYGAQAGGAAPARVTNAADYANVPKGAQYVAPDGTTRTKQ